MNYCHKEKDIAGLLVEAEAPFHPLQRNRVQGFDIYPILFYKYIKKVPKMPQTPQNSYFAIISETNIANVLEDQKGSLSGIIILVRFT